MPGDLGRQALVASGARVKEGPAETAVVELDQPAALGELRDEVVADDERYGSGRVDEQRVVTRLHDGGCHVVESGRYGSGARFPRDERIQAGERQQCLPTVSALYDGAAVVEERHRHRYEVNNAYRERLEAAGLVFSGLSPDNRLVEFIELPRDTHPFFVATQAHPEFLSRPTRPHPLFSGLIAAALARSRGTETGTGTRAVASA